MGNDELIKLALKITEENNQNYRFSVKQQAYMIKAKDLLGTTDTFITKSGFETADQWKSAFLSAGFKDVQILPFRSSGNLSLGDVDPLFLTEVSKRAKWKFQTKPEGYNTMLTPYNPYAGKDLNFDTSDSRLGGSITYDDTNEYMKYLYENHFQSEKQRIFAGWFSGDLVDWLNKIVSLDPSVEEDLKKEFAYMYSSPKLAQFKYDMSVHKPEFDFKTFSPSKSQIKDFPISMIPLMDILISSNVDLDEYPEGLIIPILDGIVEKAKNHKFYKQYQQSDMDAMQQSEIDAQLEKDVNNWNIFKKVLRGISR